MSSARRSGVPVSFSRSDYGSSLRDAAGVLALAAESRPMPPVVPILAKVVADEWKAKQTLSTQEQTWMLLAARAGWDMGLTLAWTVPITGIAQLAFTWVSAHRAGFRFAPGLPRLTP